jgi:hypothetical protein
VSDENGCQAEPTGAEASHGRLWTGGRRKASPFRFPRRVTRDRAGDCRWLGTRCAADACPAEHADRAHTDHDLAGWADDAGNFDPTPGEADVNVLQLPVSQRLRAGLLTWLTIMNCG